MMSDQRKAAEAPLPSEPHRYTITSEGASLGYFRLVEDSEGVWVQWAEVVQLRQSLAESQQALAVAQEGAQFYLQRADSRDFLDAILRAAGVFMTDTERARALSEIEIRLGELRRALLQARDDARKLPSE